MSAIEKSMEKLLWFVLNHIWLIVIIFGGLALVGSIVRTLSVKTCPDCLNKSVPKNARVCQKCGYRFRD
jgi:hypothetical protein